MIEFLAAAAVVGAQPGGGQKEPAGKTLDYRCELRTPAGDILGLNFTPVMMGEKEVLVIGSRDNKSWPGEDNSLLAFYQKSGDAEAQFEAGKHRIRIDKAGSVRNMTIWSSEDEKVKQPVAFGYCVGFDIEGEANLAPADIDPFDPSRWKDGCYLTTTGKSPIRSRFKMSHDSKNGSLFASFSDGDQGQFVNPAKVKREILKNAPKAEHPDIFMGVGRFTDENSNKGPKGMDVFYLDLKNSIFTKVVRFNTVNGEDGPAFAICSGEVIAVEGNEK